MTPTELYHATWILHPAPVDNNNEIMAPWIAKNRVLSCIKSSEGIFVIARINDKIIESWKIIS